jgi:hypothetical protein
LKGRQGDAYFIIEREGEFSAVQHQFTNLTFRYRRPEAVTISHASS